MRSAMRQHPSIALVGFGAIGRQLYDLLQQNEAAGWVKAVIEHPGRLADARATLPAAVLVSSQLRDAADAGADLVIECAGHRALREQGGAALEAGMDLLVASVGALADRDLEAALRAAAQRAGRRIMIPSGALGGLDVLCAARHAGLKEVTYVSNKSCAAWRGTPAEQAIDLDALAQPTVFFSGSAREAALAYPQNANVAAAVALAGLGFERTRVELTADPQATGNRHRIRASGDFGAIDVTVEGRTLPANPKTSILAPMSLLNAVLKQGDRLTFA